MVLHAEAVDYSLSNFPLELVEKLPPQLQVLAHCSAVEVAPDIGVQLFAPVSDILFGLLDLLLEILVDQGLEAAGMADELLELVKGTFVHGPGMVDRILKKLFGKLGLPLEVTFELAQTDQEVVLYQAFGLELKLAVEKTDLELMGVPGTIDRVEVVPGTVGFELQLAFAEAHQGRVVYFGKPHLDLTLHSQLEFGKPDLQWTFGMIGLYLAVAWNSGKADCD